jgi:MFS transporter, UMF1 family
LERLAVFCVQMETTAATRVYKEPNRKLERSWAMYDWANSVFPLSITTAIFPIYFEGITRKASESAGLVRDGKFYINFLGYEFINTALYSYSLSFSFLLIAIIQPLLSGIADVKAMKKGFLQLFCYLGALSSALLYLFDPAHIWVGILFFITGMMGYAGSIVFYNAFLPEITTEDRYDKVSAKGYSYGYLGSVLLLIVSLALIILTEVPKDGGKPMLTFISQEMATRVSFVMVALWWAGFAQVTFRALPKEEKRARGGAIGRGFAELKKVWKEIRLQPELMRYLRAFFFVSMGLQTVMYVASLFGAKVLGLPTVNLIAAVLLINLIGIPGSLFFSWLSGKSGHNFTIRILIVVWVLVAVFAYFINSPVQFYMLGALVGTIMGGIQSLLRSTYAKILPDDTYNHASYFSFYDVAEKLAIVIGTFAYGFIEELTGSMRNSALALSVFFVLGLIFMSRIKNFRGIHAG